ncbi:hypothetical protein AeRB84_011499 [Aphanomyces euteiches]|nr:hypothetical protein AeRB84_011499 [Aphanomyces euteiches]
METSQAKPTLLTAMGLSFFLPNILGCFIMGLCQPLKARFKQYDEVWTGITTGFCGCCTTFATWELHTAYQYLSHLQVNATFVFCAQLVCCFGAHWTGVYVASEPLSPHADAQVLVKRLQTNITEEEECDKWQAVMDALDAVPAPRPTATPDQPVAVARSCLASFFISLVVVTACAIVHQPTWSSMWIGPFGALLRYDLGKRFNRSGHIPYGTLAANLLASTIDCFIVLYVNKPEWLGPAIMTGFCGSLSTVSSWGNELNTLSVPMAVKYGLLTHILALGLCLLVLGASQKIDSINL